MRQLEIRFDQPGLLNWVELFGREAPVELELGFGKARFLLESARSRPQTDFLGVERARKWFREGKRRLGEDSPANLRVCHGEALDFLCRRVPDGSLNALHVYHPDPWPKKRHHKRRLISPEFLGQARRCLAGGAELRITTDHEGYAAIIAELLTETPGLAALDWDLDDPNTHFEAKYRAVGRRIHRFRLRRVEGS